MERVNIIFAGLIFLNILPWCFWPSEEGSGSSENLVGKIAAMEKEFQDFEALASWTSDAQAALENPPEEDAKTFINRLQGLARAWQINLQETSQSGDNPAFIAITGEGDYKALTNLMNELSKSPAVILQKISLATQDNQALHARLELSVRAGPWQGLPVKIRHEPIPEPPPPTPLGTIDLFGSKAAEVIQPSQEPMVQYLGFSSGDGKPSGIIEENNTTLLVGPGETTPSGLKVVSLTQDVLEISNTGGKRWKIPLKKSN